MSSISNNPALTALNSSLQAEQTRSNISFLVAAKALDAARQQGDAATALLDAAVALSKSTTTGGQFDARG